MNLTGNYTPCFVHVPDDWRGRWELLREFARRWHGLALDPAGLSSSIAKQEEARLGVTLPPSFREWIAFAEELLANHAFDILRDCYEVTRLEDHAAISLMLQGEADLYWAVNEADLNQDDPPVTLYSLDYDAEEEGRFLPEETPIPHITSFVMGHLTGCLFGGGGGAHVEVTSDEAFMTEMCHAFPVYSCFDHLHIFEAENLIAVLHPIANAPEKSMLLVEIWKPISRQQIPACILANLNRGGAFHGMLIPAS